MSEPGLTSAEPVAIYGYRPPEASRKFSTGGARRKGKAVWRRNVREAKGKSGEGVKKLTRRVILSEGKDQSTLFSVHTVILRCLRMTTEGMSMTYSKFFTSSESSF